MARPRTADIDLLRVVKLLHAQLTPALCQAAFGRGRRTERQRAWTLTALVQFWTAVIMRAPTALSQALADSLDGREPMFPRIPATPEAFFQRCRDLRPAFFAEVFAQFTAGVLKLAPPRYAADLAPVFARFPAVVILDGSRLAAIARRLKLLWAERAVVLPGALLGVYDLGRGLCRALHFDPDAAASEFGRARTVVTTLPRDTLVLGDRLYATAAFFNVLHTQHCWGVVRRQRSLGLHKLERRRKRRFLGGDLEDWVVRAGAGARAPAPTLRYIRWRRAGLRFEVLTNVLSPTRLAAEEALSLYPFRWSIERMFFDLKEVLHLNRLYAAPIPTPSPCRSTPPPSSTTPAGSRRARPPSNWACRLKRFRPRSCFPRSRWRAFSICMRKSGSGNGAGAMHGRIRISSCGGALIAGPAPPGRRCGWSIVTTSDAGDASARPGTGGNPSGVFVAVNASWRNYLSGDDRKRYGRPERVRGIQRRAIEQQRTRAAEPWRVNPPALRCFDVHAR